MISLIKPRTSVGIQFRQSRLQAHLVPAPPDHRSKIPKKKESEKQPKNPTEKSQSNSFDPAADMEPALPIKRANKAPCKNDRKAYLQKVMLTR